MELVGKRIAILAEDDYQEMELWYPLYRMREAGANVFVRKPFVIAKLVSRVEQLLAARSGSR